MNPTADVGFMLGLVELRPRISWAQVPTSTQGFSFFFLSFFFWLNEKIKAKTAKSK